MIIDKFSATYLIEAAISYGVVFQASPSTTLPSRRVILMGIFSLSMKDQIFKATNENTIKIIAMICYYCSKI